MERINRDVVIAVVLLVFCGILFWSSFDIRQTDYGNMRASTWPRVILAVLAFLSVIYLVQSLRRGPEGETADTAPRQPGIRGWIAHWRNPLWCFALFYAYVATLPVLGMLIGGILFVFVLMGVLGGWEGRKPLFHAAVATLMIGSIWSLFTFGLGVMLPRGEIFDPF